MKYLTETDEAAYAAECDECPYNSEQADENGVSHECIAENVYDCPYQVDDAGEVVEA